MADLPEGFIYRPGFAGPDEERALLDRVRGIEFSEVRMHGVTARRRVAHFGWLYGFGSGKIEPGPPIPDFLLPLRERLAGLAGVEAERLAEALVIEYPAGAGIGWHRDAPPFGIVAAFSLLSRCRFKLRCGASGRAHVALDIEPRSAYLLSGAARWQWQHGIAPAKEPRYSVTFRTLRDKGSEGSRA